MSTEFDVAVIGGTIVDPGSSRRERGDVGIVGDRVAAVAPGLAASNARRTIDATGCLVTPGLIDFHVHSYPGVNMYGIDVDRSCLAGGVTTAIDAGSSGMVNFAGFRDGVAASSTTRLLAFVCIAKHGVMHGPGELVDLEFADVEGTARTIVEHPAIAVGVKVRLARHHVYDHGKEALALALAAGEASGSPIMVHIGHTGLSIEAIADSRRAGDVITHCFTPLEPTFVDDRGRVLPAVVAAHERGVRFDVGHARRHLSFDIARTCIDAGVVPDFISTDLHLNARMGALVRDLPGVLTKFLALGMSVDEILATCTSQAADAIGWGDRLGRLEVGREADVAVLEPVSGDLEVADSTGARIPAPTALVARWTIRAGTPFRADDYRPVPGP